MKIESVIQYKNLLNLPNSDVICDFFHTFQNLCTAKWLVCLVGAVDILYQGEMEPREKGSGVIEIYSYFLLFICCNLSADMNNI